MSSERNRLDQGGNPPNEGETSDTFNEPEPISVEVMQEVADTFKLDLEDLAEKGIRIDLLLYLLEKVEIGSVNSFNAKELVSCMRVLENLSPKQTGWQERFRSIQWDDRSLNPKVLKNKP